MKDLGKTNSPIKDVNVVDLFESGDEQKEQKFNDSVMDKHLSSLEGDTITKSNTCDISKYMADLKEKHMESMKLTEMHDQKSSDLDNTSNKKSSESEQSSSDVDTVIIDTKVDKVFKSDKSDKNQNQKSDKNSLKSPRTSISMSRSPDRSKSTGSSTGSSPVRIIKIKSPKNVSRDSSKDRSPDRCDRRRSSEGGILKRSLSPKPETSCSSSSSSTGILKRFPSPMSKSRSPERNISSRKSLSPGNSIDSRSPDRNRLSPQRSIESRSPDLRYYSRESFSPRNSFDSRSSDPINMYLPKSAMKSSYGYFESRSPPDHSYNAGRKRSSSVHGTFEKSKSPEPSYEYYPINQSHSPEKHRKRLSKSLERTSSKDSAYRYGLSPERIYTQKGPIRSVSSESNHFIHGSHSPRSNESLNRSIEHLTCVDCLYQQKPVQQKTEKAEKARMRQSRARKKTPRGASASYPANKDGCVDCHDHYEIHV